MRGSRKGYNADIENTLTRLEDDEVSISAGSSRVERVHFYSHVVPRRRSKRAGRSTSPRANPDIDLSLVSILSSKDLDRPFLTDVETDDSNSSGTSRANYKTIVKKIKHACPAARPLAVIDYGSVELDMSGSLLDSIYKIDKIGLSSGGSRDVVLGGRRFSFNYESKATNYDEAVRKTDMRARVAPEAAYSTTSILNPGACSAAKITSSEASIIYSSKCVATVNLAPITTLHFERSYCKKQKIAKEDIQESICIPIVVNVPITLEASVSFSPFARYDRSIIFSYLVLAFFTHILIGDTGFCFVHKHRSLFCTPTLHMEHWSRIDLQNLSW